MILELEIERLDIFRQVRPGCRVPDMPYPCNALEISEDGRGENIGNKSRALEFMNVYTIKSGYAGAFLATVLESV